MMKRIFVVAGLAIVAPSLALAAQGPVPNVPEIDALSGLAAIAAVGAVGALIWERRRR